MHSSHLLDGNVLFLYKSVTTACKTIENASFESGVWVLFACTVCTAEYSKQHNSSCLKHFVQFVCMDLLV